MTSDDPTGRALAWVRALPALLRDACAALVAVGVVVAGASLPSIEVPLVLLLLGFVVVLAALTFGRASALLAALVAGLALRGLLPGGIGAQAMGTATKVALLLALIAAAFGASALIESWRRRRAEAERAYSVMDVEVRAAAERLETARQRLREAEQRLAEARQLAERRPAAAVRAQGGDRGVEDAFRDALRSEGGL